MAMKDALLPEFDHEMSTTRRVLERMPESDLAWKPHDKSMSLGQLAAHIASMPLLCSMTLERTTLDLDELGEEARLRQPLSRDSVLQDFAEKRAKARAKLAEITDGELMTSWTLKKGGHDIFTMPRISALRSLVMNHMIHHRGQLSVYLRLKNISVPPIYGPSADEQ